MVDFRKALQREKRAVLIPTKGRPKTLRKLFERQPFLNDRHTYVGVERREWPLYKSLFEPGGPAGLARVVNYDNPHGITSVAREYLRQYVKAHGGKYHTILPLDDNMFYSRDSLDALVDCSVFLNQTEPTIVSGEHPTAPHMQADRIALAKIVGENRWTVFPHTTVIYWAIPAQLYWEYQYPDDCCFDDIHLAMWLMTRGVTRWCVCREAPFDKRRYEPGGQGNAAERAVKFGRGITRLALDYPQWMTTGIVQTRIPYARILKAVSDGKTKFE